MSSRISTLNKFSKCKCKTGEENDEVCKYWEGPAILSHGSHLRFGCLDFIFVIVDYDFISAKNLQSPIQISSKRFFDGKKKKNSPVSSVLGIRKDVIKFTIGNNKKMIRLRKLKQGTNQLMMKKKLEKKANLKTSKINKIEAFIKLMNNKNKKSLLNFS